jgi:hypothetical protein
MGNMEMLRVDTTVELSGRRRMDGIQMTFKMDAVVFVFRTDEQNEKIKERKFKTRNYSHLELNASVGNNEPVS